MKYLCYAKRKDRNPVVHQVGVKSFSRTSPKVSIDLANETEKRLLKSGKDKRLGNKSIVKPIYNENSEIDEETTMAVFETFWDNTVVSSWQEDLQYGDYVYSKEQNFLQMITNLVILTQKC